VNVFNRIVTVLLLLFLWILIILVAAVPQGMIDLARQGLDWAQQMLVVLETLQPQWLFPLLQVATVLLTTIIALLLLWLELRRPRTPAVKVHLESGGEASVTADSVARRLAWHLDQLADVVSVAPHVRTRGGGVDIQLDLETAPDVDVPMKTEEVVAVTREVIESQMGLQLNKVKVNIQHTDFPETL
jgi:hypothetical protein